MDSIRLAKLDRLLSGYDRLDSQHRSIEDIVNGTCRDKSYIRSNIHLAANTLLKGQPLQGKLEEFIANALLDIGLHNVDANTAFQLKTGHKQKADKPKEVSITLFVLWIIEAKSLTVREAFRRIGVLRDVCLSPEQVEKIYYKHKKTIEKEISEMSL